MFNKCMKLMKWMAIYLYVEAQSVCFYLLKKQGVYVKKSSLFQFL